MVDFLVFFWAPISAVLLLGWVGMVMALVHQGLDDEAIKIIRWSFLGIVFWPFAILYGLYRAGRIIVLGRK